MFVFRNVFSSRRRLQRPYKSGALDRWVESRSDMIMICLNFVRNGNWVIQSEMSPGHQLVLGKDESQGYPFGRFNWRLGSNASFCSRPPGG